MVSTRLGQVGGHDSTATSADCQQVDDLNIHAKGIKHRWPNLLGLPGRVHHPGGQRHGRLVDLDGIQVVGKLQLRSFPGSLRMGTFRDSPSPMHYLNMAMK